MKTRRRISFLVVCFVLILAMALVLTGCPDAGIDPPGDDSLSDDNGDSVVDMAAIPGITVPTGGDTPATTITETDQYTGTVSWSPDDDPFKYGTEYTATITLTAKSGYTLTGVEANFFTVDGADTVTHDADSGVVTAVFPVTYSIGDTGPSGGLVFYENPDYATDGWRYLEAAPAGWSGTTDDPTYIFGYYRLTDDGTNMAVGTEIGIGTGKANTQKLVDAMESAAYSSWDGSARTEEYAARMCAEYQEGEHANWFLPSNDELKLMYENLHKKNLGGFSDHFYWSSSEYNGPNAWSQNFSEGRQYFISRSILNALRVRPVRAF